MLCLKHFGVRLFYIYTILKYATYTLKIMKKLAFQATIKRIMFKANNRNKIYQNKYKIITKPIGLCLFYCSTFLFKKAIATI